jgi:D-glycero-alpha-D-manno-heptose 1-phosphate guanylyltransferase
MKAVILAGGFGTRLRSVVSDLPKPMAPVGGRPFLAYLVDWLRSQDILDIVFSTGYLSRVIEGHFGDGRSFGVRIRYSREEEPLGTGGAIRLAARLIEGETFLLMNGDSFFGIDLDALREFHILHGATGAMALAQMEDISRYGKVEVGPGGEVTSFSEKGGVGSGLINAGIYVIGRPMIEEIPPGKVSLESEVLPRMVGRGLYGVAFRGLFVDIGLPEDYRTVCERPELLMVRNISHPWHP